EGVVVSRQICLIALAIRQRLVFETIWSLIGSNRCRQRSTTSKPAMESEPFLFQDYHQALTVLNFGLSLAQINVGRVPRQAARNGVRTDSVYTSLLGFKARSIFLVRIDYY
ncbi:hypothetical protein, partial [Lapidilactobacillus wuchangensis]|uniref:hypothetical protein n=1 Tax=Lapidilactobacillus wuchangensis TaxID=2486001 RepID=UPI0013DE5088